MPSKTRQRSLATCTALFSTLAQAPVGKEKTQHRPRQRDVPLLHQPVLGVELQNPEHQRDGGSGRTDDAVPDVHDSPARGLESVFDGLGEGISFGYCNVCLGFGFYRLDAQFALKAQHLLGALVLGSVKVGLKAQAVDFKLVVLLLVVPSRNFAPHHPKYRAAKEGEKGFNHYISVVLVEGNERPTPQIILTAPVPGPNDVAAPCPPPYVLPVPPEPGFPA